MDLEKLIISSGVAWDFGLISAELTYAYVLLFDREVSASSAKQSNPIRPRFPGVTSIGEGRYSGTAHVIGAGVRMEWE